MTNPVDPKPFNDQKREASISENTGKEEVINLNSEILYDEKKIDKNLVSYLNPQSFEAEQFKILRTHIFFPLAGKIPRMIAVTSSVPGEGKSFVAANLAVSIAREIDKFVLLIDCDLRKPTIHKYFGFKDNLLGLSDHISQKTPLSSVLLQTAVEKLKILPAGSPIDNPSELLSSDQMAAMLKEVSQRYRDRMIILDTTPVTMTAEAVTLTRLVDGVLLVARHGYTPKSYMEDLVKNIDREKIIGTVLNNVDMRSLNQYEYKKYQKKYYFRDPKE